MPRVLSLLRKMASDSHGDGGTSRPADVLERSAHGGACGLTSVWSLDWCSSVDGLEGQHHCLESDAGRNRKPVEVTGGESHVRIDRYPFNATHRCY